MRGRLVRRSTPMTPPTRILRPPPRRLDAAMHQLASAIAAPQPAEARGILLANPSSFSRQLCLELPGTPTLPTGRERAAAGLCLACHRAAPPQCRRRRERNGRSFLAGRRPKRPWSGRIAAIRPAAGTPCWATSLFTVVIDSTSGAIRSISDNYTRGPRLAQQLAMRLAPYTAGKADKRRPIPSWRPTR